MIAQGDPAPRRAAGRVLSVVLCAAALAACGEGPGTRVVSTAEPPQIRDSAGVRIVTNGAGPGLLGDTLGLREAFRVGAPTSEGPDRFSRIRDVVVDQAGRVFVANGDPSLVRVFTAGGSFLREFGRPGEGPGGMSRVWSLTLTWDDRLVVSDGSLYEEIAVFDGEGELLEGWASPLPVGAPAARLRARTRDGWLATRLIPGHGEWRGQITLNAVMPADPAAGTLGNPMASFPVLDLQVTADGVVRELLPVPVGTVSFRPDGWFYRAHGATYRIDAFDERGIRRMTVERATRPVARESSLVDPSLAAIGAYGERIRASGRSESDVRAATDPLRAIVAGGVANGLPGPPSITGRVLIARGGELWVERIDHLPLALLEVARWTDGAASPRVPGAASRWDLFGPEGEFLGTVVLPPEFTPMSVHGLAVAGVLEGREGGEYVLRYEVVAERDD